MHWKQNFDYNYAGAYMLGDKTEQIATIKSTGKETVKNPQGQDEIVFVVYLKETKPLICNKTNAKTIAKLYGPHIEDWIGKRITLYAAKVKAFGDTVDAIRIRDYKPKNVSIDTSKSTKLLQESKTLEELKNRFTSLPKDHQTALVKVKDEMKTKLS